VDAGAAVRYRRGRRIQRQGARESRWRAIVTGDGGDGRRGAVAGVFAGADSGCPGALHMQLWRGTDSSERVAAERAGSAGVCVSLAPSISTLERTAGGVAGSRALAEATGRSERDADVSGLEREGRSG
jgi:hypothetical protein